MFEIIGKYNKAVVYARSVDAESYAQVMRMCNTPELAGCAIRMMPDMHAAEGCTVGTSMTVADRVNPACVGGDIGCGMQVYRLRETELDFAALDDVIRRKIPSGAAIFDHFHPRIQEIPLDDLYCRRELQHKTVACSLGTLGGGNHFIEVDRALDGGLYLVIHSGSRRLGRDVADYHQKAAFFIAHGISPEEAEKKKLKIADVQVKVRPENCFLSGAPMERYFHDMNIAVRYARISRQSMGEAILSALGLHVEEEFTTVHNYVDTEHRILRKGAVSAGAGERLIIPINMRDGSLICRGRGNPDWNCTAPHGAGRILKRSEAKASLSIEEYRRQMQGVFSTSVGESTLDESPMAYRSIDDITDAVEPTVEITDIITPVYNFKASKSAADGTD